nr:superoxide dismutase 1 [Geocoris pallidipennis]
MSLIAEFDVQMKCKSCSEKIEKALKNLDGVSNVEVSFEKGSVVIESKLSSSVVQRAIESTGCIAVLKGYGGKFNVEKKVSGGGDSLTTKAAVAMLGYPVGFGLNSVKGVVRFVQATDQTCVVEGTIDGLTPGLHGLHIHECGDISKGCESVGEHFDLLGSHHGAPSDGIGKRHTGDLGNICADNSGRAEFRLEDDQVKVWDVIGRSVVVTEDPDDLGKGPSQASLIDGSSGKRLACGIISRSAGLFENAKKICACDGVTLWDERNRPLAGPGRRQPTASL